MYNRYDVLWLDIEHTNNKQYFTFDKDTFPNPRQLIDELWSKGRRMVNVIDPHLSTNSEYNVNRIAKERDLFIKDSVYYYISYNYYFILFRKVIYLLDNVGLVNQIIWIIEIQK